MKFNRNLIVKLQGSKALLFRRLSSDHAFTSYQLEKMILYNTDKPKLIP